MSAAMTSSDRLQSVAQFWHWRESRLTLAACPACNGVRPFVRLSRNEVAVRCLACRASSVTLSLIAVLRQRLPALAGQPVFEMSSRGALHRWLQRQHCALTSSEYFAGVASGEYRDGVLCQDVQALSFADASFALCTSTDVFEHVTDDRKGFAHVARVLRRGGLFVFTVPLYDAAATEERVRFAVDGTIEHLLPPEYHGDPVGASGRILALRNYGRDIVDRLVAAGFASAEVVMPAQRWLGSARPVVVAIK